MSIKSVSIAVAVVTILAGGVFFFQQSTASRHNPTKAELLHVVELMFDTTDIYGRVIENDRAFMTAVRQPMIVGNKPTKEFYRSAWRKSLDVVETGSYEPQLQELIDREVSTSEVNDHLLQTQTALRALEQRSDKFSDDYQEVVSSLGPLLIETEAFNKAALQPGKNSSFNGEYCLRKGLLMEGLERATADIASLPDPKDKPVDDEYVNRRERLLTAQADFMFSPIHAYFEKKTPTAGVVER